MHKRLKIFRFFIISSLTLLAAIFFAFVALAITPPPITPTTTDITFNWLNHNKGESSPLIAQAYYDTINAPPTLAQWRALYGFDGTDEVQALYYNAADLGFGRDMHCREGVDFIACVVGNYGLGAAGPEHYALENGIAGKDILASVAMVYEKRDSNPDPFPGNENNRVKFYVYDAGGNLTTAVPLDSEGEKYVPHMCLACHGGLMPIVDTDIGGTPITVTVDGANFLPFDPFSFIYSEQAGYSRAAQEEALRQLNALVNKTTPPDAVIDLIDGLYDGDVDVNNTVALEYVPDIWKGTPEETEVYEKVITPYCRTCHVAQVAWPVNSPSLFTGISGEIAVFTNTIMPHAELTLNNFWRYGDAGTPGFLARENGWSTVVNTTNDSATGGCPGSCSLREAIILANAGSENIITFDPTSTDGITITLSLVGVGADSAAVGDLDLEGTTGRIMILGNGPGKTIIDGAAIDRVIHVAPGVQVYMQGLTIRGGATSESGGGVFNQGNLILNDVILVGNTANSGGGIANAGHLSVDDSAVINNIAVNGGGINNSAIFSLTTTTISSNSGSGLASSGHMTVTNSTVTGNSAAGLENSAGTVSMGTTVLAGNGGPDCSGAITSTGYNLVETVASCSFSGVTGTNISGVPAKLGPLEIPEGGLTPAHIPLPGSPLLDAVPYEENPLLFVSMADQHGILRPQLEQNDIGAIERISLEQIYMPAMSGGYLSAPDLVVTSVSASADDFLVVIKNQGNAPVTDSFWVDLYIDPSPAPTAVNQIWTDLADEGLVWGVTAPIPPGESLNLTFSTDPADVHPFYYPPESNYSGNLTPGTPVYAQVDSAYFDIDTGAVLENHEINGGTYNNINSTIAVPALMTTPQTPAITPHGFRPTSPLPARR